MQDSPAHAPAHRLALPCTLFVAAFFQASDVQMLPLFFPEFKLLWPDFAEPGESLGTAYALGAATIPFLLSARWPRAAPERLTPIALGVLAALSWAFAAAPPFTTALAVRFLAGGASGVLSYAALGLAVRAGGHAVPALTAGFLLAFVLGPAAGAFLGGHLSLSAPWLLGGAALALAALGSALLLRRPAPSTVHLTAARGFFELLRDRSLLGPLVASVLIAAAVAGPVALFPSALADPSGAALDLTGRGLVFLGAGLGPLCALPFGRRITGTLGTARSARFGAVLLVPALLALPWASRGAVLAAAILGLALWVETLRRSALQELIGRLAPAEDRARYLTLRALAVQLGIAGGMFAAGRLKASFGLDGAALLGVALALTSIAFLPRGADHNTTAPAGGV